MTSRHEELLEGKHCNLFDEKFHPGNYIQESRRGLHKVHILLEWNISEKTFLNWMNKHEALQDAFYIGQAAFQVYWIDFLKDNLILHDRQSFNQRGWEKIMSYGEIHSGQRTMFLKDLKSKKTIREKNDAVLEYLCDQLITLNEAHQLQDLINKQSKLVEVQDLLEKVEAIEAEYGKK